MKKMFVMVMMLVVAMVANAQIITDYCTIDGVGVIYLSNGQKIADTTLPRGVNYTTGKTIEQCIAQAQYEKYMDEMKHYQLPIGGYYGGGAFYGGGSGISIGNEHWGIDVNVPNNYGYGYYGYGYEPSATAGIRIGNFHISGALPVSKVSKAAKAAKKAAAKAAAERYSAMKSVVATSNNTTQATVANADAETTTNSSSSNAVTVKKMMKGF